MSDVNLTIAGRTYAVACAAGQEAHVEALGRSIDARIAAQGNLAGQSETRTLLFAALFLADELDEANAARIQSAAAKADDTADALESVANVLENLAVQLEG